MERSEEAPLNVLVANGRIALHAMQGGKRADCEDSFGVSPEALKKHLWTVYDRTGTASWLELRELFLGA